MPILYLPAANVKACSFHAQGYTIRLFTDKQLNQGLADYTAVYNASWKAHELYGDIVTGMVKRFSQQGWLRLAVLYVEQEPVAAQLWFVVQKRQYFQARL